MSEQSSDSQNSSVPPKPAEAAKVQPKKETVRITLPPKPSAGPSIKIPAGGAAPKPPAAAPAAAPVGRTPPPAPASSAPAAAPAAPAAPSLARSAAPAAAPRSAAPRPAAVSPMDKGLAITAAVLAVLAFVRVLLLG